jgi:hypothetical protein
MPGLTRAASKAAIAENREVLVTAAPLNHYEARLV